MSRGEMRGHSHMIDGMRSGRRADPRCCHRSRNSPRVYSAAANSTSALRKHCQRQPQHRNRDYPNSSHSSTMPFAEPRPNKS
jgi:hypothetical protein